MAEQTQLIIEEKKESKEPISALYSSLDSSINGLSTAEAKQRLKQYGYNQAISNKELNTFLQLLNKFINPLTITLILVATLSFFLGQKIDSTIVILLACLSVILSFVQEYNASKTAKKLNELVKVTTVVIRDGKKISVPIKDIVPGDIIELTAGKMVPADVRIISSTALSVNQSALNGESFPVDKGENLPSSKLTSIFASKNLAFMGSSVAGGTAQAIVLFTGKNTEFGKLSLDLTSSYKAESAFDTGIKKFTYLMIKLITILIVVVFLANFALKGNPVESLLFALAIAVGLTPEMLPVIITINLSTGAQNMAKKKVIVKELSAIENFGAMDVLCTDKTGTLTADQVVLIDYQNPLGVKSEAVFELAYINSFFQTGLENLLDSAIIKHQKIDTKNIKKVAEIPFDFTRRILSVIVESGKSKLIAKGAPEEIILRASHYFVDETTHKITDEKKQQFIKEFQDLSKEGFRVLALGYKEVDKRTAYSSVDEQDLIFAGFISFLDPPKPTAKFAIEKLERLGIKLKVLTGDNELVTRRICEELNFTVEGVLNGTDIAKLDDKELCSAVEKTTIFVRLTPENKKRVILALKQKGHTIGFLGDGINDAPSLKAADVGISVNNGSDIAKETAEIILMEKNLTILADCVVEGRKTFGNTLKYIKMGASSNFGNMFSMTIASLILPFLPMLPTQILLNNFLYDISQVSLPSDNVDEEYLNRPRSWNINYLKELIIYVGPVSSIFDLITFAIMIYVFHAPEALFHTGWFVESLTTQVFVIYIIRTNKIPFLESRPSKTLLLSTLAIVLIGALLPFTSLGTYFGFTKLPALYFILLAIISIVYLFLVQIVKDLLLERINE